MKIPLIRVEITNKKSRWFWDKDQAVLFACSFYNTDTINTNHPPVYKINFSLEPEDICKFLNEREMNNG
jgi:hypothetical protein